MLRRDKQNFQQISKQRGATLITAMLILLVMTIVSVAALKISVVDVLVAGNDQEKMMLHEETNSELNLLTTPEKLFVPLVENHFNDDVSEFNFETENEFREKITKMDISYECNGIGGQATSIGQGVPPCDLYDFEVKARRAGSGAREKLRRGAGKEVPNRANNSFLN